MYKYQCHTTMYQAVEHYAQSNPDKIAVYSDGHAFSYRKLLEKIQIVSVLLKKAEMVNGDRV